MNKKIVYILALGLGIAVTGFTQTTIYANPVFNTFDESSNELIGAKKDSENDGRGTLIAIIDAGADFDHEAFRLDEGVEKKYTRESMQALITKEALPGAWKNDKVVYAYDYVKNSSYSIKNYNNDHGTHVAGIVAGNPPDTSKYARGVAPNAQLAIMKVFGNDKNKGAKSSDYARAIRDAIKLGADTINMSLGGGAGISLMEDATFVKALDDAKKAGIYVVIANGNDGNFGFLSGLPKVENPDYGVVATPAIFPDSFSVASYENTKSTVKYFDIENPEESKKKIYISNPLNPDRISSYNGVGANFTNIVYCGYGSKAEFSGKNIRNKVVLVDRGNNITFEEKAKNASDGYASMLVVANNENSGLITGMSIGDVRIAATSISKADGEYLKTHLDKKIKLSENVDIIESPIKDMMSDFSAWGLSAEGDLKPDITAPGGNIYSSVGHTKYDSQSGTSMAAPQISAVLAVLKNRLSSKINVTDKDENQALVKTIVMNTAIAKKDTEKDAFISPRKQGAGLVNIDNALKTKALVYAVNKKGTKVGSINLGNISDSIDLNYKVKNISNTQISYKQEIFINTDEVIDGHFTLRPKFLKKIEGENINLNANEEKELTKSINLSELNFVKPENGAYIDGFIVLSADNEPTLSVPFSGFVGDFANLPVIEKPIYDLLKEGKTPMYLTEEEKKKTMEGQYKQHAYGGDGYNFTHLYTMVDTKVQVLGSNIGLNPNEFYTKEHLAISPNGDGRNDFVRFTGTFLRSFKDMQISIYKKGESESLYTSKQDMIGLKNYFAGNKNNKSLSGADWSWHGEDARKTGIISPLSIFDTTSSATRNKPKDINMVEDGDYTFKVSVKPVVENALPQTMEFDIKVDRVKPEINASTYNRDTRTFTITDVLENGSGIRRIGLKYKAENNTDIILDATKTDNSYVCKLPEGVEENKINVYIEDWANNRYDYKLLDSIRDGRGQVIIRPELIGEGELPKLLTTLKKGEDIVEDKLNLDLDTDYSLGISLDNEEYEIYGDSTYNFRLTNDSKVKIIDIKIRKVKKVSIISRVRTHAKYNGNINIKAVNKKTKKEYIFKKSYVKGNYDIDDIPVGEYDIKIEDVADGFEAKAEPSSINITGGFGEFLGGIATKISYNKLGEEAEPENDATVLMYKSWSNEYKDISIENPIYFKFIDKTTNKVYIRKYDPLNMETTLPHGSYRVELETPIEGYELLGEDFYKDVPAEFNVEERGSKSFTFKLKKTDKNKEEKPNTEKPLPKKEENPKDNTVSKETKQKVYLQKAYIDEYPDYSTKPITFVFTSIKDSSKVYKKSYSSTKDYLVELPEGKYKVSLEGAKGYKLKITNSEDNIIDVKYDSISRYVSVIFGVVKDNKEDKKDEPKEEKKEVKYGKAWLQPSGTNEYKDYGSKPIIFVFKNVKTGEMIEKTYASVIDYKQELAYGTYEVSVKNLDKYDFKLEVVENNTFTLNENTLDHESLIFTLTLKKVVDEDKQNEDNIEKIKEDDSPGNNEKVEETSKENEVEKEKSNKKEVAENKKENLATKSEVSKIEEVLENTDKKSNNDEIIINTGNTNSSSGVSGSSKGVSSMTSARLASNIDSKNITKSIIVGKEIKSKISDLNAWIRLKDGLWTYQEGADSLKASWLKYNNKWFYLDEKGIMAENAWIFAGNSWFYAKKDGYLAENEWILVDGKWYYAVEGGYILLNTTKNINEKVYSFDKNGALIK